MSFNCYIVGEGTLPIQCAEILIRRGHRVEGVISPDASCIRWAQERKIPHADMKQDLVAFLVAQPFDFLFSIVNQSILPKEVFALPRRESINYHDGPLPRYAGTHATSWALMNREKTHGVTWHAIVETVDAGDIFKQRFVDIAAGESAVTLNAKCYAAAMESFAELVDEFSEGRISPQKQKLEDRTYFARHKRPSNASVISWKNSADEICALVRALDFGPYPNALGLAKFALVDDFIVVRDLQPTDTKSVAAAGTITRLNSTDITVSTATYDVVMQKLQTVDGEDLAVSEIAMKYGLCEGFRLKELDAVNAQRVSAFNESVCKNESFWVRRLASLETPSIPYTIPNERLSSEVSGTSSISIPVPKSIEGLVQQRFSSFSRHEFLLSAFAAYVSRICSARQFDIGFTSAELKSETAGLEGLFAASVPLKVEVDLDRNLGVVLEAMKEKLEQARRRKTYARDVVARFPNLRLETDSKAGSFWPVAAECVATLDGHEQSVRAGLCLVIAERGDACRLDFALRFVNESQASCMAEQFITFLSGLAADPACQISHLPLLPERERQMLLVEFNDTKSEFSVDQCMHSQFELQAERMPDEKALSCRGRTWTFRELNEQAEVIAQRLRATGAKPDTVVGICMERSLELIAGMLGILKSGAAYLPLDATYPADRIAGMVEDAQPLLVLSSRVVADRLSGVRSPLMFIEDEGEMMQSAGGFMAGNEITVDGQHLAYVIYTSGSTGKPKGVMVEHRNAVNFFSGMDAVIGSERGVWLSVASVSFDISVLEIWWSLTRGFHVVLWPGVEDGRDASITELIRQYNVSHMQCVPSFMRMVLMQPGAVETLATMRVQVMGGEAVPPALIRDLGPSPTRRIFDMYGPTEAAVVSTTFEVKPGVTEVAIGRPIANTQIYILDGHSQLLPVGLVGELHIGGAGVTRGYLNHPELTRDKFVPNPFSGVKEERLYRTGDLARYRPDGNIEYVGRVDGQVKIRGHRVEVGEIEARLCMHPDVRAGVIDLQVDSKGEKRLVAYAVPATENLPTTKEFREWMSRALPSYMVPAAFVKLGELPRTANGKLDRRALPPPEEAAASSVSPERTATPLENALLEIWRETLGLQYIGLEDDFFDLGGNSLSAVQMMVAIQKQFRVEIPLQALFESPTVCLLATKLAEATGVSAAPDSSRVRGGEATVTGTERRLLEIWERLLDVRLVGVRDSFFALGGRSELLDRMLAEVRSAFGVFAEGIPVGAFIEDPTIAGLAGIIDASIRPTASLVVPLQARGDKTPLFLIHAGGGYVFFYRALALRLGVDQPVYGVRAETKSDGHGEPFHESKTVEELATRYIKQIKTVQPNGPYRLGGACIGGVIAFEMARKLCAQGDQIVGPLILFDAFVMNNPGVRKEEAVPILRQIGILPPESHHEGLLRRIAKQMSRARQLGLVRAVWHIAVKVVRNAPSEAAVALRWILRQLRKVVATAASKARPANAAEQAEEISAETVQRGFMEVFLKTSARVQSAYVPGDYDGSIVLLKAAASPDPERLWAGLAKSGMKVHKMPGAHLDMMEEPVVVNTAAIVSKYLSEETPPDIALENDSMALDGAAAEVAPVRASVSSYNRAEAVGQSAR